MIAKLQSRRFWVTVWAALTVTILMLISMITKFDPSWMSFAVPSLIGVALTWIGFEGYGRNVKKE